MGVCLVLSRGGGIVTQCQSFVLPQDGSQKKRNTWKPENSVTICDHL